MKTPTHSRKLSLLVAVLILLTGVFLGGYLVLKSDRVSAGPLDDILKGAAPDPAVCEPNAADANKDSDNDGLKDWQEIQIYQSDPCKTDSDNDGYLDGEEVSSGYNPIIKAPGDELPGTTPKGPRPLPANLTNALGSMLAQQIITGKIDSFNQNGQILSAAELEKYPALQQSVAQIVSAGDQLFAPEIIDENKIKITNDISPAAIQKYAGEAARALSIETAPGQSTPPGEDSLLTALQNNDFTGLDVEIAKYQQSYQKLAGLTVPINLIEIHKEQLNIFSKLIKINQSFSSFSEDPLKTIFALQSYQETLQQLDNWFLRLAQFLKTNYLDNGIK